MSEAGSEILVRNDIVSTAKICSQFIKNFSPKEWYINGNSDQKDVKHKTLQILF